MSKLVKTAIRTSDTHINNVIVTAQRVRNDVNGNPRFLLQLWIVRENGEGNLWCPDNLKGYRRNKQDGYTVSVQSHELDEEIQRFIIAFEQAIRFI